jgi:hypothetical protein
MTSEEPGYTKPAAHALPEPRRLHQNAERLPLGSLQILPVESWSTKLQDAFYFPLVRLRMISASRCRYGLPSA